MVKSSMKHRFRKWIFEEDTQIFYGMEAQLYKGLIFISIEIIWAKLVVGMKLENFLWDKRLLLIGLAMLFAIRPAYAYLDPSAGSIMWQSIIGIMFAFGFFIKLNWNKVRKFFKDRINEGK